MIGATGSGGGAADLRVGAWGLEGHDDLLRLRLGEVRHEASRYKPEAFEAILEDPERTHESCRDRLSTRLMELFRVHQSRAASGLLYELNAHHLLLQVASCLRRYQS